MVGNVPVMYCRTASAWGHVGTQPIPDSLAQGPSLGVEEGSDSGISGSCLGLLLNHPDSLDIYIDNLFPKISVADPGCLSRIPDPTFFHPGSRIRTVSIPDPGSSTENLSILTPKKSKIIQGSKRHPIPDPGSGTLPKIRTNVMKERSKK
jgi:hypothetical protein